MVLILTYLYTLEFQICKRTGRLLEKKSTYTLLFEFGTAPLLPILLFSPIFLLVFQEISQLYFYSDFLIYVKL